MPYVCSVQNKQIINIMQILIIIISLFGLLIHALATQDKTKFNKTDIFILTILLMGLIVSILTLTFNFI